MSAKINLEFDPDFTLYVTVQAGDGRFANVSSSQLEALSQADWSDYATACPAIVSGGRFYECDFPSWLPYGQYAITAWLRAGGSPAWATDRPVRKGKANWNGVSESTPPADGQYCSRSDVENVYGISNVKTWADLENDGNADYIAFRVNWAIDVSTAWIEDHLKGGPYAVPFTAPFPKQLVHMTARFAGVQLYESRGITDMGEDQEPIHQLSMHKKMVEQFVMDVLRGRVKFRGISRVQDAPQVITQPRFRTSHDVRYGVGLPGFLNWWDWSI